MMHQDATSPLKTTTTACTIAAATAVAACTIAAATAATAAAAAACTIAVATATAAYRANDGGADYARCPLSPRSLSTPLRRRATYSRSM